MTSSAKVGSLRSEPSAATSSGYAAASAAATSPAPGPATRRPSSPVTTTVAVPDRTPTTWCHCHDRPPSSDTNASSVGYSGGLSADGRARCEPCHRNGSM